MALHDGEFMLTYRELATTRDRLAVELGRSRVPRGTLVGLRLGHGWLSVVGILGVRKHGCGYLPLDPRHPAARQHRLLRRAGVRHLLTESPDGLALEHLPTLSGRPVRAPVR